MTFSGLGVHLGNLSRLSDARTRSISAENPDGRPGAGGMATEGNGAVAGRDLGRGWKISPCVDIPAESVRTLADIDGPGAIQHIWITMDRKFWRSLILRFHWDGEENPSIEVPLGDFFCNGWGEHASVTSIPVAVNPTGGFNSYWEMPFRRHARITVENIAPEPARGFFYQITYALTEVPDDCAYLHAQWRRSDPVDGALHTLLDGVRGRGHYVGTYLAWEAHSRGWWGEGEMKFHLDGEQWPTICGTGTEDYFGGAWGFVHPENTYGAFTGPYLGMPQVIVPDGFMRNQQRFGLYRWHVPDPIRFTESIEVTIQALGWRPEWNGEPRYLPLKDDIASTAWWYQTEPHAPHPPLPGLAGLEID
ncbi:glycoside hydrolase family 172 protein [Fodinicola acaciae]|uniref:glycoside hydrolase family 172 protein n=1 Tax=Fodinicola acaciae TaxID=2681555 RepID=UPI0013D0C8F3|nr:glycoside hydrolase family 172 protein [Fodinicola acaciae]